MIDEQKAAERGEPLTFGDLESCAIIDRAGFVVARCPGGKLIAERMLACYNACDGMDDPQTEIEGLRGELADAFDDIVRQDGFRICDTDAGELDGWWDSQALSHVCTAGDRLVELGLWECHPHGVGRRQFYRPKPQQEDKG